MVKLFWCPQCSTRTNHKKVEGGWQCRVCEYFVLDSFAEPFIEAENLGVGQYLEERFKSEGLIVRKDGR